ncbi:MAG: hypothetical protein C6I00_02825 [Nitratiruptor sp.]|nr:hypothetical protein [Nitratiruptor sp.]NPA82883.1 hypothetical protein [Campylobacterota bacterium]
MPLIALLLLFLGCAPKLPPLHLQLPKQEQKAPITIVNHLPRPWVVGFIERSWNPITIDGDIGAYFKAKLPSLLPQLPPTTIHIETFRILVQRDRALGELQTRLEVARKGNLSIKRIRVVQVAPVGANLQADLQRLLHQLLDQSLQEMARALSRM